MTSATNRSLSSAGIPQYVIVNLQDAQLEYHTQPVAAEGRYASVAVLKAHRKLRLNVGGRKLEVPLRKLLP